MSVHALFRWRNLVRCSLAASSLCLSSCSDPVLDAAIAALGDEAPGVRPGPEHRPGQPCVLCHSKAGPASDSIFVIAGTVYETVEPNAAPAANVEILVVDSGGGRPSTVVRTNSAGNFFVRAERWSGAPLFPMRVAISRSGHTVAMASHIGREPSCGGCHRPSGARGDKNATVPQVHL